MQQSKSKISQSGMMDLFGILFVIVIIVLVYVFFFSTSEKPESPQKDYITSQYANDVIDVMIRSSAYDCPNIPMKDLIQNCDEYMGDLTKDGVIKCNSISSCTYAKAELKENLDWTLKEHGGVDYYFVVYNGKIDEPEDKALGWDTDSDSDVFPDEYFKIGSIDKAGEPQPCPASKRSKTYQLPSLSGSGSIFIKLDICI